MTIHDHGRSSTAILLHALCALSLAAPAGVAADGERAFRLPAGPHAVGFRALDLLDHARSYRAPYTETGEPDTRPRARPIQTSIWYPARPSARRAMRLGEYVALQARQDGAVSPAETRAFVAGALEHLPPGGGEPRARLERALAERVSAVRGAEPLPGRHPVVLYNAGGGQPSWDNSVLYEYLASHGFVVVASPNTWNWSRLQADGERASAEASARDLEFLLGHARTLPYADLERVALMGYSWGAQAAVMVALRNASVRAVVSLDGSEGNPEPQWEQSPQRDPRRMRAAYLGLHGSVERSVLSGTVRGAPPPSEEELRIARERLAHPPIAEGLRHADAYTVVMERFHHGNFASHWLLLRMDEDRRPGEPTLEEDRDGYAAMSRYVLQFLRGYLRDDGAARAWLARTPAENGIPPGTLRARFLAARPWPRPSVDTFARRAREHGFEELRALVARARAEEPGYGLGEEDLLLWADLLEHAHRPQEALRVIRWAAELLPRSAGVHRQLCSRLEDDRPARLACYRTLVELEPDDQEAKEALRKLEGS